MPRTTLIKPTQQYYQALQTYGEHHVKHEGTLETAHLQFIRPSSEPD